MQQYQNYFNPAGQAVQPVYPNYNFQPVQTQNPYIDRYVQQQQAQQMFPSQMSGTSQQQVQGLNGRIVDDFEKITANDVPMDAMGAWFIKSDMSEIQRRYWNEYGSIDKNRFKRVSDDKENNLPQAEENAKFDLSEASTEVFMKRFDDITERLEKMEKNFGRTARGKKESETNE